MISVYLIIKDVEGSDLGLFNIRPTKYCGRAEEKHESHLSG